MCCFLVVCRCGNVRCGKGQLTACLSYLSSVGYNRRAKLIQISFTTKYFCFFNKSFGVGCRFGRLQGIIGLKNHISFIRFISRIWCTTLF